MRLCKSFYLVFGTFHAFYFEALLPDLGFVFEDLSREFPLLVGEYQHSDVADDHIRLHPDCAPGWGR